MTRVRLEIIGAGAMGARKHLLAPADVPEIEVAVLCRRDAEQLRGLAGRFGIPAAYPDYRDLLSEPVGAPVPGILPGKGSS
jgi:predicted dehydrogenase